MTPTTTPLRVVVTGAGRGIGAALATKAAAMGAHVVVSDINESDVQAVANTIGAYAVPADIGTAAGVATLIEEATAHLGDIDIFFANAGIIGESGLGDSDAAWAQILDVNVLAHVRAARLLMPRWVERGSGRFVVTASAAGLLSMVDAASYSVTKHAAVALAEWLAITYGSAGVIVQALCPQGVRTPMLDASAHLAELLSAHGALEPTDVADIVWGAFEDNRFLILPHPEVADFSKFRAATRTAGSPNAAAPSQGRCGKTAQQEVGA